MKPSAATIIFHVSNIEKALQYYTEVLGFAIDWHYGDIVGLEYGAVMINLSGPNPHVTKKAIGEGHVYIFCDEVDEYFRDITAKGAAIHVTLDDRQYGMRDFAIQDPDGNILAFGKELHL